MNNIKCYVLIELMFLNKLMLIKQADQKKVIFVTIGVLKTKDLSLIICME